PLGPIPATAHDVLREARVMESVAGAVPVPRVVARCDDHDVIGAPFVVVEYLEGTVLREPDDGDLLPEAARARVGASLVDTLLALHSIDPHRLGMEKLAQRRDYVTR